MQQVYVKFDSAEQILDFVNVVNRCDAEFEMGTDSHIHVNAKSLLGVLSLDFTKPMLVRYNSHDEKIRNMLRPFVCVNTRRYNHV